MLDAIVRLTPVAVMSSHSSEHSMSTTTLPALPEAVPVTLMSIYGGPVVQVSEHTPVSARRRTMNVRDGELARVLCAD